MTSHASTCALILGGTQGPGLAIAEQLVADGCTNLVLAARDPVKGEAAAAKLGAGFLSVDLADCQDVMACVEGAAARMGRLDAMCIAGASTDRGSILETTPEGALTACLP